MAKLIDKDVLVAEIDKRESILDIDSPFGQGGMIELELVKDLINTLEVKEVDLEEEIQDHIEECLDVKFPTTDIELIKKDVAYTARKFFALGLKARQG